MSWSRIRDLPENLKKKYTLLHYAVVDNRVLVFNFSCPIDQKDQWVDTAWKIMDSIRLKKINFFNAECPQSGALHEASLK